MVYGQETKLGYMVFDEAHTLFLESRFRKTVNNIVNLSWDKWKKTLFLSATMDQSLFQRIVKDRNIPEALQETSLFVNTIDKVPEVDVEVEVEQLKYRDVSSQATRLVRNFINNTSDSKAVFFFSSKDRLRAVFEAVRGYGAVAMVDADLVESEKRRVFDDFEDIHSQTRVVMGTKLLSNGLDCKSVQFICLVDCSIDCVDYLQMVGRIRHWGFVKSLAVQGKRVFPPDTEIGRRFPTIDWRHCVTENVARFYNVPFQGHNGCCGVEKGDQRIQELKEKLEDDSTQGSQESNGRQEVVNLDSGDGVIEPQLNEVTRRVHKFLSMPGSNVLMKDWRQILRAYKCKPTKVLLANIEPRHIVTWSDTISSNVCADCLMPVHSNENCTVTGKIVGGLVYELLAILKVVGQRTDYHRIREQFPIKGASKFLVTLPISDMNYIKGQFFRLNQAFMTPPTEAKDREGMVLNPVETFQKYFELIWSRHINVMFLIFRGEVDHCPASFLSMTNYYSAVFKNRINIESIANNDDSAIFAIYKRHALADLEAWYCFQLKTTADRQLVAEFLGDIKNIPVVVTMIWAVYESGKYRDALDSYITVNNFDFPDTFPVFFRYMCSTVVYRAREVPLYVVFLGIILENMRSLQLASNYFVRRSGPGSSSE